MGGEETGGRGAVLTRRRALGAGLGACAAGVAAALGVAKFAGGGLAMGDEGRLGQGRAAAEGRLAARPRRAGEEGGRGLHQLKLGRGRDGLVYAPAARADGRAAPLVLMLHGAGGDARQAVSLLRKLSDEWGLILLAPDSRGRTWDVIEGGDFGPDVDYVERALAQTFARYDIDPARVAVGGFSDGASYALSLGPTNGDLFTHVLAFSPGFMAPGERRGSPALFVSHGVRDRVLPIDACSRRIVPRARRAGYEVEYREFDGPHTVPPEVARGAIEWFLKRGAA